MAAHRLPRATKDLDLWIRPASDNAKRVLQALDAFGAPRQGLNAADLEREGTIYQVGVPPNRVDVITVVEGVSFETAWRDRTEVEIEGLRIPVIGRNHLILHKRTVGLPADPWIDRFLPSPKPEENLSGRRFIWPLSGGHSEIAQTR